MRLHLDFETASDLDLPTVGLYNYITHPSTRVLLAAWMTVDRSGRHGKQRDFLDGFEDLKADVEAATEIHAWNAPFEWAVMTYVLGWNVPLEKMRCTMAHALYRAFPAKLTQSAKIMLGREKMKDATRLLSLFSQGRGKAKPGDWDLFCQYNRDDVEMELGIHDFLISAGLPWPTHEYQIWLESERVNWRGIPISVEDAIAARDLHNKITFAALTEIKVLTGVENPNSPKQLSEWLGVGSLAKDAMPALLASAEGTRKQVLELRQQVALSAPKKYGVAVQQQNQGLLRNLLQYSGAGRTHRWSGRGVQPHNLRRGWKDDQKIADAWDWIHGQAAQEVKDPFNTLADLVRSMITVPGQQIGVADYASIEVVMLHWGAGDEPMLNDLRNGLDAYKRFASTHWGIPLSQVDANQRTFSKPVVLGAGYGLGADTLVDYAKNMGVTIEPDEARGAITTYRGANKLVVRFWYGMEEAMIKAIENPGKTYRYGHFAFKMLDSGACMMGLPSGSAITYWNAKVVNGGIVYEGVNQYTGHWSRIHTWGGKLVENAVQSISRDVLVHGLLNALRADLDVFLHVHDEIAVLLRSPAELKTLQECMVAPPWCADAPIRTAIFACPRYRKD